MKFELFVFVFFYFSNLALAGTVKQVLNDHNLAIVEIKKNEQISVGESFIAADEKSQCLLEVLSIKDNLVTVSSKSCTDKSMITIGKSLEKSLFAEGLVSKEVKVETVEQEKPPVKEISVNEEYINDERNYSSVVINYMLSPRIKLEGTAYAGTQSESGTFEYSFSNAIKFGYEWSQFKKYSWNSGFFVDYASLKFDSATITGAVSGSSTVSLTGGMNVLTLAYAGKYRGDKFYFPVSMGLVSSTVDSTGWFTKVLETRIMASLGFGIAINDKFNFEFSSNATSIAPATATSGGTTITSKTGYLNNLQISAKFLIR